MLRYGGSESGIGVCIILQRRGRPWLHPAQTCGNCSYQYTSWQLEFELEVAQAILQTLIERQVLASSSSCQELWNQLMLIQFIVAAKAVENALSGTWPHFFAVGLGLSLILARTGSIVEPYVRRRMRSKSQHARCTRQLFLGRNHNLFGGYFRRVRRVCPCWPLQESTEWPGCSSITQFWDFESKYSPWSRLCWEMIVSVDFVSELYKSFQAMYISSTFFNRDGWVAASFWSVTSPIVSLVANSGLLYLGQQAKTRQMNHLSLGSLVLNIWK